MKLAEKFNTHINKLDESKMSKGDLTLHILKIKQEYGQGKLQGWFRDSVLKDHPELESQGMAQVEKIWNEFDAIQLKRNRDCYNTLKELDTDIDFEIRKLERENFMSFKLTDAIKTVTGWNTRRVKLRYVFETSVWYNNVRSPKPFTLFITIDYTLSIKLNKLVPKFNIEIDGNLVKRLDADKLEKFNRNFISMLNSKTLATAVDKHLGKIYDVDLGTAVNMPS